MIYTHHSHKNKLILDEKYLSDILILTLTRIYFYPSSIDNAYVIRSIIMAGRQPPGGGTGSMAVVGSGVTSSRTVTAPTQLTRHIQTVEFYPSTTLDPLFVQ